MSNPKVSIIVPVYNTEHYLKQCLDSIIKQTLKDIEIICVDDGSTDNSLKILKDYEKKDNRFKIISKSNSGYGHTMNVGLDAATSEYIGIVESDDYIDKNMFKFLYNKAKKYNLDISRSDFIEFSKSHQEYILAASDLKYYNKPLKPTEHPSIFDFRMNTWASIYKASFLKQHNIKHNETPGASFQDAGFWFQNYMLANSLMIFNKAFYHYRQDNIASSINSTEKANCIIEEFDFIKNKIHKSKLHSTNLMNIFYRTKYNHYLYNFYRIKPELRHVYINKFSSEFNNISSSNLKLSTNEKIRFELIKTNPNCFLEQNKNKTLNDYKFESQNIQQTNNKGLIKRLFHTLKDYGLKGILIKLKLKIKHKK